MLLFTKFCYALAQGLMQLLFNSDYKILHFSLIVCSYVLAILVISFKMNTINMDRYIIIYSYIYIEYLCIPDLRGGI